MGHEFPPLCLIHWNQLFADFHGPWNKNVCLSNHWRAHVHYVRLWWRVMIKYLWIGSTRDVRHVRLQKPLPLNLTNGSILIYPSRSIKPPPPHLIHSILPVIYCPKNYSSMARGILPARSWSRQHRTPKVIHRSNWRDMMHREVFLVLVAAVGSRRSFAVIVFVSNPLSSRACDKMGTFSLHSRMCRQWRSWHFSCRPLNLQINRR